MGKQQEYAIFSGRFSGRHTYFVHVLHSDANVVVFAAVRLWYHRRVGVLEQIAHILDHLPDDLEILVDAVADAVQVLAVFDHHVLV